MRRAGRQLCKIQRRTVSQHGRRTRGGFCPTRTDGRRKPPFCGAILPARSRGGGIAASRAAPLPHLKMTRPKACRIASGPPQTVGLGATRPEMRSDVLLAGGYFRSRGKERSVPGAKRQRPDRRMSAADRARPLRQRALVAAMCALPRTNREYRAPGVFSTCKGKGSFPLTILHAISTATAEKGHITVSKSGPYG